MKNKKIAFDLDGVVYNFIDAFDEFITNKGHCVLESEYDRGLTRSQAIDLINEFGLTRPFLNIPLYQKAKEEMLRLSKDNELYIITYRDWTEFGIKDTLKRVAKDGLPVKPENIIFDKNKGFHANRLNIDLFYEDSLSNVEDILRSSNSLVKLVDTPYNQSKEIKAERIKW